MSLRLIKPDAERQESERRAVGLLLSLGTITDPRYRLVFEAVMELIQSGKSVDLVTVGDLVRDQLDWPAMIRELLHDLTWLCSSCRVNPRLAICSGCHGKLREGSLEREQGKRARAETVP